MSDLTALSYTPTEQSSCPAAPAYALWHDVLLQAIFDLQFHPLDSRSSHRWFLSDSVEIGSFLWICYTVGGDPKYLRRKHAVELDVLLRGSRKRINN